MTSGRQILLGVTAAALALAALMLAGCTTSNDDLASADDSAARFLVAPGKYRLFNCQQIRDEAARNATRRHELEALMVKSAAGSGGDLVNAVAYRPEYLTLRGEMIDLRQTAVDKRCNFVPGEARSASGRAMR